MKKVFLLLLIVATLFIGCTDQTANNEISELKEKVDGIIKDNENLRSQLEELENRLEDFQVKEREDSIGEILYYMSKLKDKDFTKPYGHQEEPYTWYIAAEELGVIGKPAIPYLMKNLQTNDEYEKGLTLYALLLASQHDNVNEFTKGDYINTGLTFSPEYQKEYVRIAEEWWEKYKEYFE